MVDEFDLFVSIPLPQNSHLRAVVEVGVPGKQCRKIKKHQEFFESGSKTEICN